MKGSEKYDADIAISKLRRKAVTGIAFVSFDLTEQGGISPRKEPMTRKRRYTEIRDQRI